MAHPTENYGAKTSIRGLLLWELAVVSTWLVDAQEECGLSKRAETNPEGANSQGPLANRSPRSGTAILERISAGPLWLSQLLLHIHPYLTFPSSQRPPTRLLGPSTRPQKPASPTCCLASDLFLCLGCPLTAEAFLICSFFRFF